MAFFILTRTGKVIVRKSVWGSIHDELANPDIKLRLVELDKGIQSKFGDEFKVKDIDTPELMGSMREIPDDVFDDERTKTGDPGGAVVEADGHTHESYDEYLTAQVLLLNGREAKKATGVERKRDHDGRPIGRRQASPLIDTRS
jgi:hypothetical protein